METTEKGWGKLLEFMVSGHPGSFVLWGLLGYALISLLRRDRGSPDGSGGWWGGDCDGDGGD